LPRAEQFPAAAQAQILLSKQEAVLRLPHQFQPFLRDLVARFGDASSVGTLDGKDVIYLIGGALIRERATLADACKRLAEAVRAT
jgi:hypothetical protein